MCVRPRSEPRRPPSLAKRLLGADGGFFIRRKLCTDTVHGRGVNYKNDRGHGMPWTSTVCRALPTPCNTVKILKAHNNKCLKLQPKVYYRKILITKYSDLQTDEILIIYSASMVYDRCLRLSKKK